MRSNALFKGNALNSHCESQWFPQREDHVTCSPDALAPDPARQNTLCVSYLLGE